MATDDKDFKIKNGLVVQGTTATVNGNDILTAASVLDDLANVNTTGVVNGNSLVYNESVEAWVPGSPSGGGGGSSVTVSGTAPAFPNNGDLWLDTNISRLRVYFSTMWMTIASIEDANTLQQHTHDTSIGGSGLVISTFIEGNGAEGLYTTAIDGGTPSTTIFEETIDGGLVLT